MGDIDLFVPEADWARARAVCDRISGIPVDLHRGCPDLRDLSFHELIEGAEHVPAGPGGEILVLRPEHHLRLSCLHALRHGVARPIWLIDLAVMLERPGLDWTLVLSGDPKRSAWTTCALELAAALVAARLPEPRPWRRPSPLPAWAVPSVLRAWGVPFVPQSPMAGYWRKPREALGALAECLWRLGHFAARVVRQRPLA